MTDTKDKTCFTIMPFGGWYDHYYKHVYKAAIAEAGLVPKRADDLSRTSTIINDIWTYTKEATIVLADLSDQNSNVFYELGLAHALAKPVVLVTSSIDEVPFDLRALRVLEYDRNNPDWGDLLKKDIVKSIGELLVAPTKSVLPTFLTVEDLPEKPAVSSQEMELLQLRSEFDAFRRQYELLNNFMQNQGIHFSQAQGFGLRRQTVLLNKAKSHSKKNELDLLPELDRQIKAGLKKGASDESIVKRLMAMGAAEDIAWRQLHQQKDDREIPSESAKTL